MGKYFLKCIYSALFSTKEKKLKEFSIYYGGGKPGRLSGSRITLLKFRAWGRGGLVIFGISGDGLRIGLGEAGEMIWEIEVGKIFYLHEGSDYCDLNAPFVAYQG
jgi:hypothetical protein